MTPERWQKIKQLLGPALEMDRARQALYLDEMCAGDQTLRADVERLLAAEKQAGFEFLNDPPAANEFTSGPSERAERWLGRRIGPYQIVEEIGAGGMGEVFRAVRTDDEYQKEVAIKIVRAGANADFIIERFKNERQILATLDHPNIARLLDGGTTEEGLPYVLMELIHGDSIDEYCDKNRLSTSKRLKLFLQVCSAVQYAHQRLIVHRDIKPGNILVTAEGMPKLLDFGIAKILESGGESGVAATVTLFRPLTPGYASPEQVRGEAITTASDVYSLGVVLYELLTGQSPYSLTSRASLEIARAVCELEPDKPSVAIRRAPASVDGDERADLQMVSGVRIASREKLARRLEGDVDNIVLMALRKEPNRRYVSVEQFAEDIRRHLANLPILARTDNFSYRAQKFVKRHRVIVAAVALVLLTVIAGVAITLREARVAERRFNDVRSLATSLFDIHDSIKDLPGATPVRKVLVSRALEYLDRLSQEAAGDVSLQRELAAAYERVGDVQGNPNYANLGDVTGALQSYRKSLAIRQWLATRDPADAVSQYDLALGYTKLGAALDGAKDFSGALANYREALKILENRSKDSGDAMTRDRLAGAYYHVAIASVETGNLDDALKNAAQAISIRETIRADDHAKTTLIRTHLAGDYGSMAQILSTRGELESAVINQQKAVALLTSLAAQNPNDQTIKSFLGQAEFYLSEALEGYGRLDQALYNCKQAVQIFESLLSVDPNNAFAQKYLGLAYEVVGKLEVSKGHPKLGLKRLEKAIDILERLRARDPKTPATLAGFGESYMSMGRAYAAFARSSGKRGARVQYLRQARAWYQKSLGVWQELRERNALDPSDKNRPEEAAKDIAECDAALAKLGILTD